MIIEILTRLHIQVRNGINNYLAGYFPVENMRFRAEELTFCVSRSEGTDLIAAEGATGRSKLGEVKYPDMSKTLTQDNSEFTLNVKGGSFQGAEIIGLLGQNGCGKTTFMELLAVIYLFFSFGLYVCPCMYYCVCVTVFIHVFLYLLIDTAFITSCEMV